jgi:hypothetical protein
MIRNQFLIKVMAFVMLAGSVFFALDVEESLSSRSWPTTTGEVVAHRIEKGCGVKRGMFYAQPIYSYTVGGERLISNRIVNKVGGCLDTESHARSWLESNYPIKLTLTVYYDPGNPKSAFLRKGKVSAIEVFMAALLLIISLFSFIALNRLKFTPTVKVIIDRS